MIIDFVYYKNSNPVRVLQIYVIPTGFYNILLFFYNPYIPTGLFRQDIVRNL
jgi:hypothetical protein